ncbi:hypothetical protein BVX94_02015 [bacterium B17]|nr:hypothetical protein BVX94_02015 [bacterium B17]
MRTARLKEEGKAYYHCITRIVGRQFLLDEKEKERLRLLMRGMAIFTGVNVLTYAFLDNHWHLLLEVPERVEISDEELKRRLLGVYSKEYTGIVMGIIEGYRKSGEDVLAEEEKAKYTYRMFDVSEFMKTFKQKYTQSYNKRHGRRGTLWEERFKSILIQGSQHALLATAAYIDLNAVRAGIVKDPRNYRFCGYGEAMGGKKEARGGLLRIIQNEGIAGTWKEISSLYRKQLYVTGESGGIDETGKALKVGFAPEEVEQVVKEGGELPMTELLRCKVRYFSDGVAIGSKDYIESLFEKYRDQFGAKRKTGARRMKGGGWGGLYTIRDLRLAPITRAG